MYRYRKLLSVLAACGLLSFSGCASQQAQEPIPRDPELAITCIGVMPVQTAVDYDDRLSFAQAKQLKEGAAVLDGVLRQQLAGRNEFRYVTAEQVYGIENSIEGDFVKQLKAVGTLMGCNVMLQTQVSKYIDRVGTEYTAKEPASVTFEYKLVDINRDQVLCQGRFEETQQYVLDNLFKLKQASKRRFTFVTAPELLKEGLEEKFSHCGYLSTP
ncbi:hypothetical protein [Desulfogranum japonicum]|uniref:hypothetical protein n=1 Tax=Desulfogranum japonicum TaxID=231447 RepID=UPI00040EBDD1|nr:hypothetical protein [Desulfogranum japonicum]